MKAVLPHGRRLKGDLRMHYSLDARTAAARTESI